MVSFGTIDFNQLKGHNRVMASGPNAWRPRQHRFVWRNEQQPDREAYHQIVYNYNTLTSGNVAPMKRGQMNHFRDTHNTNYQQPHLSIRPQSAFMPAWNLFNHKSHKRGCGSCGGRR